ncbi:SIMPL domain-containing protein [Mycobacterium sp. TNTM28]|uniref:SIMPL domain-containing protein n=2 Tax=[Mycobacterium] fortunisiensis TaxID=2600579 RepID=A0ABS6KTP5_9MYCO|nr:SIMPL domain-containing protein [[Mycobacterium] fortunisiensis]
MPTEIIVRGSYSAFRAPERATVYATVADEGPTIEPVYERVVRAVDAVKTSIAPLHEPEAGPVTRWSTGQVRTWAGRPWNNEGKQLPPVHHASADIEVEFRDFAALSRWVGGHIIETGGFTLSRIAWALTVAHRDELVAEVQARAVGDAVTKAQRYADALDLGPVRPVAIGDAGMLTRPPEEPSSPRLMRAMATRGAPGARELDFTPADIEVSVAVDAKFHAGQD